VTRDLRAHTDRGPRDAGFSSGTRLAAAGKIRARSLTLCLVVASAGLARAQSEGAPGAYQSTVHARQKRDQGYPQIVLTAQDLQKRGAQNLKDALELIPEVQVRQGGNGIRFDVRGAKPRSVLLLIDGVPVDDPYNGVFDISSIPITDIVEIRVQLAPASPLEGPGGDGGVVEVMTLHATGNRRLDARVVGGTEPSGEGAVTGRTPVAGSSNVAVRASAGVHFADPGYPVVAPDMSSATFFDRDSQAYTALRLETVGERGRFTGDLWYGHRSYFIPPSDSNGALLQHIARQDAARAVFGGELLRHGFRIAIGTYGELLSQAIDKFTDYTQTSLVNHLDITSGRVGAAAIADRPFKLRGLTGLFAARLSLDGEGARILQTAAAGTWGLATYGELAVGVRLKWRWFTADAAIGGLLPLDHPSGAWPEAKLTLGFQPRPEVGVLLIGARKGRLPTISELYDPMQGNPNLSPEQTWHAEVQTYVRPHPLVSARLLGYLRRVDGMIRIAPGSGTGVMMGRNANLDTIDVRGFEAGVDIAPQRILGAGLTYVFEDANSPTLGFSPIPNFPTSRVDAYLSTAFWHRRLGGMLRFRWTDDRVVQNTTLPSFYVMDLYAWARLSNVFRASVRIDNLTNNTYQMLPGLNALGTTATATIEGVWE
jgi:outer membrane cobalamin receptor